ncbi:MAG: hypothetical protein L3K26_20660, partial [Candidatus Hydrogenedentes bacterium]|nr:hypothetical protein [Candidatus Hydrogenedentota bacterium]
LAQLKTPPTARTLEFPANTSLGKLFVRPWQTEDEGPWQERGAAQGSISVAEGVEAKLEVAYDLGGTLSALSTLDKNDLQAIGLVGEKVNNDSMEHVGLLTGLRHVTLTRTGVTDEGLRHLWELSFLHDLNIHTPKEMTDTGLAYLTAHRYLSRLSLTNTNLTFESVNTLGTFSYLRELHLSDSGISEEGIISLEGDLPNCKISY